MTTRFARGSAWWASTRLKIRDAAINCGRPFALVWRSHPPTALLMGVWTLIGAGLPAGQAWIGKLIVDAVVAALPTPVAALADARAGRRSAAPLRAAGFVLLVGSAAVSQARSLTEHVLHSRLNLSINTRIIRKALDLDLTHFENAEFYDKLQNARREADWRGLQIVNGGFYLVQNVLSLLSFSALLVRFSPLLALILFPAALPAFVAQSSYADLTFRVISWRAPEARKLAYLDYLLTDYDAVKEVKLFGLGEPLLGRYATLFWKFLREDQE